jgi:hypothetical protein
MKPPICFLCHKHFRSPNAGFALVEFADYAPLPEGYLGHPHGLEWFCNEHLAAAQAQATNSVEVAMLELHNTFGHFTASQPPVPPDSMLVRLKKVFRI